MTNIPLRTYVMNSKYQRFKIKINKYDYWYHEYTRSKLTNNTLTSTKFFRLINVYFSVSYLYTMLYISSLIKLHEGKFHISTSKILHNHTVRGLLKAKSNLAQIRHLQMQITLSIDAIYQIKLVWKISMYYLILVW